MVWGHASGRLVVDSDLDAFSQYPSHGSFATPVARLIAETRGATRGFLSYYHVLPSSRPLSLSLCGCRYLSLSLPSLARSLAHTFSSPCAERRRRGGTPRCVGMDGRREPTGLTDLLRWVPYISPARSLSLSLRGRDRNHTRRMGSSHHSIVMKHVVGGRRVKPTCLTTV